MKRYVIEMDFVFGLNPERTITFKGETDDPIVTQSVMTTKPPSIGGTGHYRLKGVYRDGILVSLDDVLADSNRRLFSVLDSEERGRINPYPR